MSVKVEICAESAERALEAQAAGMWRVELCKDLEKGGITPSPGEIQLAREQLKIHLHPIIRPRGGNFVYTDLEFEIMKRDIIFCGELACDGVVFGILTENGTLDLKRNKELVELALKYKMSTTFHRAIDQSADIFRAVKDAISCGFTRILTSGGMPTAFEGISLIRKMIEIAGEQIIIMPGCGVSKENVSQIIGETGAKEIHGTFKGGFPSL